MFDARESFNLLVESDQIDGLLKQASARVSHLTGRDTESMADVNQLQTDAKHAEKQASDAAAGLRQTLAAKTASRQEKLAILARMGQVMTRLVD